jgi:hypothetical protein
MTSNPGMVKDLLHKIITAHESTVEDVKNAIQSYIDVKVMNSVSKKSLN